MPNRLSEQRGSQANCIWRCRRLCLTLAALAPALLAAQSPGGSSWLPYDVVWPVSDAPAAQPASGLRESPGDPGTGQIGAGITSAAPNRDASAPPTPAGPLVSVHGVVRNAATGEPLPRALVRIEGDSATGALTDGDGRFEIPGLAQGPQVFEALKPGFLDRPSGDGAMPVDDATGNAHNVMVEARMPELNFTLAPACSIRGQIELSTGDPAQGIPVQLLKRNIQDGRVAWQPAAAVKSTSEGMYRFAGLAEGEYAVYTDPAMDSEPATNLVAAGSGGNVARDGYASVFYPEARDLAGAAKIRLANGEQAQANLTLTLEPFHAVTATAHFPDGQTGAPGAAADRAGMSYSAVVMDAQGHQLPYIALYEQATRTIQALLPDGTYSLLLTATPRMTGSFISSSGGRSRFVVVQNGGPYVGTVEFSVAGRPVSNLRVPLSIPHSSPVQLTLTRTAATPSSSSTSQEGEILVMLSQAGGWIADGMQSTYAQGIGPGAMEGTYTPPGPYWVHTRIAQKGICEASFTAGGSNLAREPLVLSLSGSTAPLELTVRDDCARLTLTLPAALAVVAAGEEPYYTAHVVPDFDSTVDLEPVTLRPSSGASVTLEGLTPGNYHVYLFTSPVALEYRNRAALADSGQAVTLSPGATANLLLEAPGH